MCLFAINRDKDQPCEHPECLEFYNNFSSRPPQSQALGKRQSPRNEPIEEVVQTPSKKLSKNSIQATTKLQAKEESLEQSESQDEQAKPNSKLPKDVEVSRTQFRPPSIRQQAVQEVNLSSFDRPQALGRLSLGYPANFRNSQFSTVREVYSNGNTEDCCNHPISNHIVMNEIRNQNKLLMEVNEKVDLHNKMLSILIKDYQLSRIGKAQADSNSETPERDIQEFYNLIGKGPDETISKKDMQLYLKDIEVEYKYQLEIENKIELPLVKERNFSLALSLVDNFGKPIINSNKIMMSIHLYTADNPPVKLKRNTTGSDILKGDRDNYLVDGKCIVPKLQIKEVTSHYRSGNVFLVLKPNKKNYNPLITEDKNFIDFKLIKPLVIDQIRVKAKMPKRQSDSLPL